MKNRILILSFLLLAGAAFAFGQDAGKMSLIVAECRKYVPDVWCEPQGRETVAYHFENGRLKNREVLMTGDLYPFEFRFPASTEYVYRNRYLISDGGDVYDYDARRIIYRNAGGGILTQTPTETIQNLGVVKAIGDRLIVRLAVSDAVSTNREGFYAYHLRTGAFNKIRDINDFPPLTPKNFSPDGRTIAVIQRMKLVFYAVDEKFAFRKLRSVDLGYAAPADRYDDESEDVPLVWADAGGVLTRNKAGAIVRATLRGRVFPILPPKKIAGGGEKPLDISKDRFGNFLVYPCMGDRTCLLHLPARRLAAINCEPLGNGFRATPEKKMSNNEFRQFDFFYKEQSIGKNRGCFDARSSGRYLAVENKDRNKRTAAVRVWNAVSKEWTNIEINWHPSGYIIGWIEGK